MYFNQRKMLLEIAACAETYPYHTSISGNRILFAISVKILRLWEKRLHIVTCHLRRFRHNSCFPVFVLPGSLRFLENLIKGPICSTATTSSGVANPNNSRRNLLHGLNLNLPQDNKQILDTIVSHRHMIKR